MPSTSEDVETGRNMNLRHSIPYSHCVPRTTRSHNESRDGVSNKILAAARLHSGSVPVASREAGGVTSRVAQGHGRRLPIVLISESVVPP